MAAFSTLKMLCHIADTITKTLFLVILFYKRSNTKQFLDKNTPPLKLDIKTL